MLQSRIMPFIIAKPEPRGTQADMICKSSEHCYIFQTLNIKVHLFRPISARKLNYLIIYFNIITFCSCTAFASKRTEQLDPYCRGGC